MLTFVPDTTPNRYTVNKSSKMLRYCKFYIKNQIFSLSIVLVACLMFLSGSLRASHVIGAQISYKFYGSQRIGPAAWGLTYYFYDIHVDVSEFFPGNSINLATAFVPGTSQNWSDLSGDFEIANSAPGYTLVGTEPGNPDNTEPVIQEFSCFGTVRTTRAVRRCAFLDNGQPRTVSCIIGAKVFNFNGTNYNEVFLSNIASVNNRQFITFELIATIKNVANGRSLVYTRADESLTVPYALVCQTTGGLANVNFGQARALQVPVGGAQTSYTFPPTQRATAVSGPQNVPSDFEDVTYLSPLFSSTSPFGAGGATTSTGLCTIPFVPPVWPNQMGFDASIVATNADVGSISRNVTIFVRPLQTGALTLGAPTYGSSGPVLPTHSSILNRYVLRQSCINGPFVIRYPPNVANTVPFNLSALTAGYPVVSTSPPDYTTGRVDYSGISPVPVQVYGFVATSSCHCDSRGKNFEIEVLADEAIEYSNFLTPNSSPIQGVQKSITLCQSQSGSFRINVTPQVNNLQLAYTGSTLPGSFQSVPIPVPIIWGYDALTQSVNINIVSGSLQIGTYVLNLSNPLGSQNENCGQVNSQATYRIHVIP